MLVTSKELSQALRCASGRPERDLRLSHLRAQPGLQQLPRNQLWSPGNQPIAFNQSDPCAHPCVQPHACAHSAAPAAQPPRQPSSGEPVDESSCRLSTLSPYTNPLPVLMSVQTVLLQHPVDKGLLPRVPVSYLSAGDALESCQSRWPDPACLPLPVCCLEHGGFNGALCIHRP